MEENEPIGKNKGKRPDRRLKLLERKEYSETVVKCCLKKVLNGDQEQKLLVSNIIEKRIESVSKSTVLGSINLNRLLRELFHHVPDANIHQVEIPSFDLTMIRQLMLGTEGCSAINPAIKAINNIFCI